MTHEDLTQAFYNFLGQFQAEQRFIDSIDDTVRAHAEDLDGAERVVIRAQTAILELQTKESELYPNITADVDKLYSRIGLERKQELDIQLSGIQVEYEKLKAVVTQERRDDVAKSCMTLRAELDAYSSNMDKSLKEMDFRVNSVSEHVGVVLAAQPALQPPGVGNNVGVEMQLQNLEGKIVTELNATKTGFEKMLYGEIGAIKTEMNMQGQRLGQATSELEAIGNAVRAIMENASGGSGGNISSGAPAPAGVSFGANTIASQIGLGSGWNVHGGGGGGGTGPQLFGMDTLPEPAGTSP